MQDLYDEMLPGITARQAAYGEEVAAALAEVADVDAGEPVKDRPGIERACASSRARRRRAAGRDAHLRARDARRPHARATPLPVCLANIQPVPDVTPAWDMGDLTYNQGIHGAQDTANAMVRAGRPFTVITDDWHADSFRDAMGAWARAAAAVTRWRELKVAVFGYAMNAMGDIRVDEHALMRALGPQVDALAPGALHRAAAAVPVDEVDALIAAEDAQFEIDPRSEPRRARRPRADAARRRAGAARRRLRRVLDALRRDRRGRPLRAPAARCRLQPDGQGLRLRRRGRRADRRADVGRRRRCSARRSSPRCTRWTSPPTRS